MKPFVFNQPSTKLRLAFFAVAIFFAEIVSAQTVTLTTPLDNQLFPIDRTLSPMKAGVRFTGTSTGITNIHIYESEDGGTFMLVTSIPTSGTFDVTQFVGDGTGNFLHTYAYQVKGVAGGVETGVLATANNVVGGDVYIINGQSNALSKVWDGVSDANTPATNRQWVRTYGSATRTYLGYVKHWGVADGNTQNEDTDLGIGLWPMRMASQLVGQTNIPVAIINGAVLGNVIAYFGKTFNEGLGQQNNYIRLRDRIAETKTTIFRGLLWYQGEDNADAKTTAAIYRGAYNQLYSDWTADYNPAHFYIFQIRDGCYYSTGSTQNDFLKVMEGQRQTISDHGNLTMISTNAADQYDQGLPLGFCHYTYPVGYSQIGDWARDIVLREAYAINNGVLIDPPAPTSVSFTSTSAPGVPNQVSVFVSDATATDLSMNGTSAALSPLFVLTKTGSAASFPITSIAVPSTGSGRVVVNFSGASVGTIPDSLSYLPHFGTGSGNGTPNIRNITSTNGSGTHGGLGLLNFRMQISSGILPLDPLELSASKKDKGNALHWTVETNSDFRVFLVERSEDGQNFTEIASVNPSSAALKYSYDYLDQSPTAKSLYRIRGLKKAGNYIYSQVVAINNNTTTGSGMQVYPNPVTDRATISLSLDQPTMADLQVFSVSGKLMSTRKISLQRGANYVGVSEVTVLNAGVYLLRVVTPDETFTGRLVKSK